MWQHAFVVLLFLLAMTSVVSRKPVFEPIPADLTHLPHTFVQMGDMRSATTLQFMTVCAAVAVKAMSIPNASVDCFFLQKHSPSKTAKMMVEPAANEFQVLKSHGPMADLATEKFENISALQKMHPQEGNKVWVFQTTELNVSMHDFARQHHAWNFPSVLTVDTSEVGAQGDEVDREDYERIFSLTPRESDILYDWLRLWDKLRVCCGVQMSASWRDYLKHGRGGRNLLGSHFMGQTSRSIELCTRINVTEVEQALLKTELFSKMHKAVPMLGKV